MNVLVYISYYFCVWVSPEFGWSGFVGFCLHLFVRCTKNKYTLLTRISSYVYVSLIARHICGLIRAQNSICFCCTRNIHWCYLVRVICSTNLCWCWSNCWWRDVHEISWLAVATRTAAAALHRAHHQQATHHPSGALTLALTRIRMPSWSYRIASPKWRLCLGLLCWSLQSPRPESTFVFMRRACRNFVMKWLRGSDGDDDVYPITINSIKCYVWSFQCLAFSVCLGRKMICKCQKRS